MSRQEIIKSTLKCCARVSFRKREILSEREISAISLKYGLIKVFEEKELLSQNDLKQNIIRDCFLRNKKITYCLKPDPNWKCKNWRVESADSSSGRQLYSQRMELHQATQLSDPSQREQELAMHRIGQKRKSSSRRSHDESSRNRIVEKNDGLYRS